MFVEEPQGFRPIHGDLGTKSSFDALEFCAFVQQP